MGLSIASSKNLSEEKAYKLYITLECMLEKMSTFGIHRVDWLMVRT